MNIFFEINNTSVNISKIKKIVTEGKNAVRVTYDDNSTEVYSTHGDVRCVIKRFESTIMQLVPCVTPVFNVYKNDDGSYFHERVCCLALCADGTVRSLAGCEYFDLAYEAKNFVGCYDEGALAKFPEEANSVSAE